jgi:hypothetical protein
MAALAGQRAMPTPMQVLLVLLVALVGCNAAEVSVMYDKDSKKVRL